MHARRPWDLHRHYHDERGRTRKQGPARVLPILPRQPGLGMASCWRCEAPLGDKDTCPQCGESQVPF